MSKLKIIILLITLVVLAFCEENMTISNEADTNTPIDENPTKEPVSNEHVSENDERDQFTAYAQKLTTEMIGTATEIPKAKFREFMRMLMTRGEKLEQTEEEFYFEMVDKIVEKVPETIQTSELGKYIDQDYLMNILNDIIKEKYGEEGLSDFMQNSQEPEKPDL